MFNPEQIAEAMINKTTSINITVVLASCITTIILKCMRETIWSRWWHRKFNKPYKLARPIDQGSGVPVILLHGLGRTGNVWQHLVELLKPRNMRVVAFDLLGFGASPKPQWLNYDIDDHAYAVIYGLQKLHLKEPAIIVGHSMGCLVAVRVAKLRPDLVRHLVMFEMPLYEGLPEKRRYRLRTDVYFKIYERIMAFQPGFNLQNRRLIEKLAKKIAGMEVSAESWQPFVRSLQNTIMKQTAAADIKLLKVPMDVIYGSFDMLVIRGKPQLFFGKDSSHITTHTIRAKHEISVRSSQFIVKRIAAALEGKEVEKAITKAKSNSK